MINAKHARTTFEILQEHYDTNTVGRDLLFSFKFVEVTMNLLETMTKEQIIDMYKHPPARGSKNKLCI